jgi:hypothetical protein
MFTVGSTLCSIGWGSEKRARKTLGDPAGHIPSLRRPADQLVLRCCVRPGWKKDEHMQPTGLGSKWRKSTWCGPDNGCVELAKLDGSARISVRDSKNVATSPVLAFGPLAWSRFTRTVKAGDLDLS